MKIFQLTMNILMGMYSKESIEQKIVVVVG
jgi:hypothetical protein